MPRSKPKALLWGPPKRLYFRIRSPDFRQKKFAPVVETLFHYGVKILTKRHRQNKKIVCQRQIRLLQKILHPPRCIEFILGEILSEVQFFRVCQAVGALGCYSVHFVHLCPQKESNLHFELRKLTFYPLNYRDIICDKKARILFSCQ